MVKRIFVEKKEGFDIEAKKLCEDLKYNLKIKNLKKVRIINRYDIEGIDEAVYEAAKHTVFAEPVADIAYDEEIKPVLGARSFIVEYLPGQYDQRADSAAQCIQIISMKERPLVRTAKVIVLEGGVSDDDFEKVKQYCINPVDSREAEQDKPAGLAMNLAEPPDVEIIEGFACMSDADIADYRDRMGFAMSTEDLIFVRDYFANEEKRNPTITELKVLDTYWSDHCRHTTFLTQITDISFEDGKYSELFKAVYSDYLKMREELPGGSEKDITLMDLAVISAKYFKIKGLLADLDESDEINACSIKVTALVDGKNEEWLVMFKNETHNHPTEIEPFGGAATCLGGAIRDPLSGRAYVYQAMRVTGSGDPRTDIDKTLPGKLPQRKITTDAAHGYSSYGNQVGLATGQVAEIYHEGYVAKRMEVGAVIGAVPAANVRRETPKKGDIVILVGGRTGRDGCGGATGSSKEHTEESILSCGAEVQKGNPPTERNLQRLFRRPEAAKLIKRCNDFGAGGVSVAVGEIADSIDVNLDLILKKYDGLDGTELAISESQERMAVVVDPEDAKEFIRYADEENLEAVAIAEVTDTGRFRMYWRGCCILNLSRNFLNTNGVRQKTGVFVVQPKEDENYFKAVKHANADLKSEWTKCCCDLNNASQKGLAERFDSTIGAGTVLLPLGGKYQMTPAEGMVAKLPVMNGETNTATIMTYGFNPLISSWSPFHGALYAVVESITKLAAIGGDYSSARLSFQEYFEKLGNDPRRWGKPFAALLGALAAQKELGTPSIGGKDSMSGSFMDLSVPPTLISFAVCAIDAANVISPEFKKEGSILVYLRTGRDQSEIIDFSEYKKNMKKIYSLNMQKKILAAKSVGHGGIAAAVTKMAAGNLMGAEIFGIEKDDIFEPAYGSVILEIPGDQNISELFEGTNYRIIGKTISEQWIDVCGEKIELETLLAKWSEQLEPVFPAKDAAEGQPEIYVYTARSEAKPKVRYARPRVYIPVFPGTNCEYDSKRAFEKAGALVSMQIFRNLTSDALNDSIVKMAEQIKLSQIIMIPGGFSGGDEPDGSAKFIAAVFRNPLIKEAVTDLLENRDGLMLGICNGFQALIKLGLLPYGQIREISKHDPTLTFNRIGRHASCMVRTKIVSVLSPWLDNVNIGDVHTIPVSHGEGRFIGDRDVIRKLFENGQVATQYVDNEGMPSCDIRYNPNGSTDAIEGITSPDGRIFGKMGHSERIGENLYKNSYGSTDQKIFEAGVNYFK